jgi:hypothetical protein
MRKFLLPLFGVAALLLAACAGASTFPEKAYKVGTAANVSYKAANAYMEAAQPSSEVTGKITAAINKANPLVEELLVCAREIVAAEQSGEVPAEAAALGLDSEAAIEAQEEACEGLLSRAVTVLQAVQDAVDS